MIVFDNIKRTDASFMKNSESEFEFYNRSSKPEVESVRRLIEEFISHYPEKEVIELVHRLRSTDNANFRSAVFELFLHEALLRQGYTLSI
ncbi:MAG: hypothetical protein KDK66_07630, partial [Deltaproteobacteria bacterium]|nr:hypothetical protein [Deltaproteobacteria bacterium]